MAQLDAPILCLVTDRKRHPGRRLDDVVRQAVDQGVSMVQLREKDLSARDLYELGKRLMDAIGGRADLIVNDRVDAAIAIGAEGVQLPENGLPPSVVRGMVGSKVLIGRSVHSVDGAIEAEARGADFLVAGTIFAGSGPPKGPILGTAFLRQLSREISIPFLAIGGVDAGNASLAMEAGSSGVAVITAISDAADPGKAAKSLLNEVTRFRQT